MSITCNAVTVERHTKVSLTSWTHFNLAPSQTLQQTCEFRNEIRDFLDRNNFISLFETLFVHLTITKHEQ